MLVVALMVLTSCGKKKYFVVEGELENLGAQIVMMTYYADGGIKRESVSAVDGKFTIKGESVEPTLCLIEVSGVQIANVVAQNGEKIMMKGDVSDPYNLKLSGNGTTKDINAFVRENADVLVAGNAREVNGRLAEFVGKHRNEMSSVALMVSYFNTPGYEVMADSLLSIIKPEVRTASLMQNFGAVLATQLTKHAAREVVPMSLYLRKDTIISYSPSGSSYSIMAFLGDSKPMRDSVTPMLRDMSKMPSRRLQVVEVSMAADSVAWKRSTATDSAEWHQAWAPGTVAGVELHKLSVPRIPFFILVDSAGTQVLRSSSVKAVRSEIKRVLPVRQ